METEIQSRAKAVRATLKEGRFAVAHVASAKHDLLRAGGLPETQCAGGVQQSRRRLQIAVAPWAIEARRLLGALASSRHSLVVADEDASGPRVRASRHGIV
ncbi:MAG: hypothetical protein ABI680_03970 [Chthoniobacteraceae bacterium]